MSASKLQQKYPNSGLKRLHTQTRMLHRMYNAVPRHIRQTVVFLAAVAMFVFMHSKCTIAAYRIQQIHHDIIEDQKYQAILRERKLPQSVHLPEFDLRFRNPCFWDTYDNAISNNEYYSRNTLLKIMEEKYGEQYIDTLHRSYTVTKNGSVMRLRCLPYYYILGSAKSGTTDLKGRLRCHHQVLKAVRKEPMWLNLYRFENISLDNYLDIFDLAAFKMAHVYNRTRSYYDPLYYRLYGNKIPYIVGDQSSMTLSARKFYKPGNTGNTWPNSTAALIQMLTPMARFIVLLRNPAERVYSYYKMHYAISPEHFHEGVVTAIKWWQNCIQSRGIGEHCLYHNHQYDEIYHTEWDYADALSAVRQSIYVYYLQEWFSFLPQSNFLILKSEQYYANVIDIVNKQVFPFLGLEPKKLECVETFEASKPISRLHQLGERQINLDYKEPMLERTKNLMDEFYKPYNLELATLLNDEKWIW